MANNDLFSWLTDKSSMIKKDAELFRNISSGIFRKANPWSILKLIALGYIIPIYTNIIGNKKDIFNKMIYVDFFSGSGINEVKYGSNSYSFLGSPFVAINAAKKPFDHMYFIEKDSVNANALEERLKVKEKQDGFQWLQNNYSVLQEDANTAINKILPMLAKSKTHSFIFMDPDAMEIKWNTLDQVARSTRSDLFINIMSHEIHRAEMGVTGKSKKINDWFGSTKWKSHKSRLEVVKSYTKNVSNIPDKSNNKRIENSLIPVNAKAKIKDDPYYYLLFATIKTRRGSPWMRAVRRVENQLRIADDNLIKKVIDVIYQGQQNAGDWFE